jgi:hypothetical protein
MQVLRTPRDTMHSVVDAMQHWDSGGKRRALDTMDLSQIRPGYRVDQGPLQAQYMMAGDTRRSSQPCSLTMGPGASSSHRRARAITPAGASPPRRWPHSFASSSSPRTCLPFGVCPCWYRPAGCCPATTNHRCFALAPRSLRVVRIRELADYRISLVAADCSVRWYRWSSASSACCCVCWDRPRTRISIAGWLLPSLGTISAAA